MSRAIEIMRNGEVVSKHYVARNKKWISRILPNEKTPIDTDGIVNIPCMVIHSFFRKSSVNVIYLGKGDRVLKTEVKLKPWRLSMNLRARAVLELYCDNNSNRPIIKEGDVISWVG
ncbi:hypothetical protein [Parendozoicomonas sp. Alg238-R29]|uniref:hypothetical protein n=1 Tax=Parendozoicomonas sp. Alg238-R29 TaxID=2993446 RepID=UPI00248ED3FF|nr:hypothetical protein [Parendozoicomonas sp. Alg238-R29]